MLVAKKNDSVTWTVPSSKETVDPFGKPHWSSIFGNIKMLDIRFQFSTTPEFKDTKAHWYANRIKASYVNGAAGVN